MTHQWHRTIGLGIALASCAVGGVRFMPAGSALPSAAAQGIRQPAPVTGATTTRLADGRSLIVGGQDTNGPVSTATIVDVTGATTVLPLGLQQARAGHAATLMPDGTVLISGGRGSAGQIGTLAELFDPSSNTFLPIGMSGAESRSGQTATLLTDGRVLIAGGIGADGSPLNTAEIWDIARNTATATSGVLVHARVNHRADLLGDGRVLLNGGTGQEASTAAETEIFDPATQRFVVMPMPEPDHTAPQLTASLPDAAAVDVPLDVRVALRFSQPLRPDTVTTETVGLTGPDGPIEIAVVPAENGRLAFVTPRLPLTPETTYVLTVEGAANQRGLPLARTTVPLTTVADPRRPSSPAEPESWTPGADGSPRGWQSNRPDSPWRSMAPLQAAPGVTAVAGQVLRLDGRPLADVVLSMEGRTARTDRTGRFLLLVNGLASAEHTLAIDGRPASHGQRRYGFYEARIVLKAGVTNVLPFTVWSPLLDVTHEVTIPSPTTTELVVTTPTMPGLELHLPAGTVIRDEDGAVVTKLTLTPIPLDRTPFPLPSDAPFSMFFTIQPGGAYIYTPGPTKGAWLVYPNRTTFRPGTKVQFYNYDPDDKGWFVYGLGTVTATQVVPAPTTRFYAFTGASFNTGPPPPAGGGTPGGGRSADPIDPSTGAYLMEKTDLYVPDVMPLALTRTYNSMDAYQRAFGIGMTHAYGLFQYTTNSFNTGDLILPDGGQIHYVRTSADGLPWYQTVFECQTAPTAFYKSRLLFNGNAWEYTLKNGTVYVLGHQAPLQSIRDQYGNVTRLTWSDTNIWGAGVGNLVRITSPNGRWIAFTYDTSNRVTQAQDNLGRTVSYIYDASGRLSTVTDPEQNVTTYTWDANNRLATIKDGRNIVYLTNHYDASGRVDHQTLADPAASYSMAYTTDPTTGAITQTAITDPRGHVQQLSFNPSHYLTTDVEAATAPEQRTTTIDRQPGSNLPSAITDGLVVDGVLRRTEYTYDDSGHVRTVTQLAGTLDAVTTTYTYEPLFFQLATITDPLQHTWTIGYDVNGRMTSVTDPLTHQTALAMNTLGQTTSVTDPLQHVWQFGYTGGDQTSVTNPIGSTWRSFTDAAGRVLSTTDPLGRVTRLVPDKLDRVTSITDPIGAQTQVQFDPNSRVLSLTDALTHTTSYTYDANDRAATRTDPVQKLALYGYDSTGNLTQVTDRKGQVTSYQYDALNRVTLVTYADAATTQYTYDAGDRLRQIDDSIAGRITREYDGLDRVVSETTPEGSIGYTYDADGRRATMTVTGQSPVSYVYDDAHRLVSITQGTSVVGFIYDEADRRSALMLPNGVMTAYGYDTANQLTSLTYTLGQTTLGTLTYTYDAAGRRTSVDGTWARAGLPQALASATYDAANRITAWTGQPFSYDPNGNLTTDGLTSYVWDARNQLTALSGAASASFAYDGVGRRRAKTVGGTTANFLYDRVNLVQELSGSTPTANLLTGGGIDETLTRTDGSATSTLLTDALGSTLELADASGTLQTHYTYEPFGAATASGATSANAQQFTGRENDGGALYFYRARYYSPTFGRFISEDSIGSTGDDSNLYRYVWNSPTNVIDPLGEFGVGVSLGGAAEAGVVVGAGAQGAVGAGGFVNTNNGSLSAGGFASGGAFAGGPGWGASAPSQPGNGNWVAGGFVGGGASVWVSNANNVCDLSGPFKTYSVNAGWGVRVATVNVSVGQNAAGHTIVVVNYGGPIPPVPVTGGGFGASLSAYNTNTVTTAGRGCGCK